MARDLIMLLLSTTTFEATFSTSNSDEKIRLKEDVFETLMCLNN